MTLFKLIAPSAHISGVDKIFGQDWNDLINTLTGGLANLITLTGGLTMSGSDITLAGNKINTTNLTIKEIALIGLSQSILVQATLGNISTGIAVAPSGTLNVSSYLLFRTSDTTTNYEALRIVSDINATGQFVIESFKGGTGTLRPITVYMSGTKLLSFDTANTITSYTQFIIQESSGTALQMYRPDNLLGNAFPQSIAFYKNNSAGTKIIMGGFEFYWASNTAGSETANGALTIMKAGSNVFGPAIWSDTLFTFQSGWDILFNGKIITAAAQESTGAGSALLGANSPAVTLTAPYKWIKFQTSDGSTVYIPAWK